MKIHISISGTKPGQILSTAEVAQLTGRKLQSIHAAVFRGNGPEAVRVGGRAIGFTPEAVVEWVTSMTRRAA